jgi:hypothetical protein
MESLEILEHFDVRLTRFRGNRNLLDKFSDRFLVTLQLFIGRNILIEEYT